MKKIIITLLMVTFVMALFAGNNISVLHPKAKVLASKDGVRGEVYYQQDFEGDETWTTQDGTLPSQMWHVDDFLTPDGTGTAWWMGDTTLNGYIDHLYLVLDTEEITVPAGGHLTFDLNYNVEPPGTSGNYDGWDGCNIRISTDGGTTWSVINGDPAYNCTSMYSFGFEHGEGEGVPGWGGSSDGWVNADFDLSAYAGQDVKIRFAFASDPAYNTQDNPDMFGMVVDNITLGSFENTGVDDGTMTASSMVPAGGDIWHLAEVSDAPTPTHAMVCQNDQGSYNPNMLDYWISDTITLPQSDEITTDFMIKGAFADPDEFPEVDFWGWEITPDDGLHWYAMSNPYGDPNGTNYVYSDAPDTWSSVTESYSVDGNISDYAGQDVKFRVYFQTDADAPDGTGIMIDNYTVYYAVGDPATNLTAELNNDGGVDLAWTAPGSGGGQEGWINWDSGENADGIGTGSAAVIDVAARFTSSELIDGQITKIKFFPKEAECTYTLKVWTGSTGGELAYEQAVANPTIDDWNEIILDTPVAVDPAIDYWVGYTADTQSGYPCGVDAGPMVPDRGGYLRLGGGAWAQLTDYDLDYNWNIQAYLEGTDGQTVVMNNMPNRDVTGYQIYRSTDNENFDMLEEITPAEAYTDASPVEEATNFYYVVALYDGQQSAPSNTASVYVPNSSAVEIAYDDGSAESSMVPSSGNTVITKFSPDTSEGTFNMTHLKAYIANVGTAQILVRIYADNGGVPGDMIIQFSYSHDSIVEGWNYIPIPDANLDDAHFDGDFYAGIFALPGASEIGVDTNTNGSSFVSSGTDWDEYTEGNVMFRAVGAGTSNTPNTITPVKIIATNYPNPFNPVTTISYNIPNAGHVSVEIYNIAGQKVKTLVNENQSAGANSVIWNGTNDNGKTVASGVYMYKIKNGKHTSTKKMILMK